ncbi:hypothetical protein OSB04_017606 [Centaurea solstitialis]|uniref:Uncharacterized protein n=1 Tax=Centaurea solstitialis TaxID=347529 RepID=A0AA38TGD9_9ASTR|nr:hypothetical protein OSB04_017606 [Centaurea solstitialis]
MNFDGVGCSGSTVDEMGSFGGYISPDYQYTGVVSGKKNRGFCHDSHGKNLLGHHRAEDRPPTMLSVVLMLVSDSVLPPPKQPAFFTEESFHEHDSWPLCRRHPDCSLVVSVAVAAAVPPSPLTTVRYSACT